jgi:hypothetical protein
VASQEAIKQLGTNGGGFFGANSTHPFENPTRLTNLLQVVLLLLIPFALALAFGRMAKDRKQGRVVFAAMFALWLLAALLASAAETSTASTSASSPSGARARRPASAPPVAACTPRPPPARRPARSTACTTRCRRSAAARRWPT